MIGSFLKERRELLGVSQSDLAVLIGRTKQTVLKWENDVTEPRVSEVLLLAEVFSVSPGEICFGCLSDDLPFPSGQKYVVDSDDLNVIFKRF